MTKGNKVLGDNGLHKLLLIAMVMRLSSHANAIIMDKITAYKEIISNQYGVVCNLVNSFSGLRWNLKGLKYQTKSEFIWRRA